MTVRKATEHRRKKPRQIDLSVEGFKSFHNRCSVRLRPLTVLSGPNSSGKSSFLQPFLLLKQTEEEPGIVGPLHLSGPYVNFRNYSELFWHAAGQHSQSYSVGISDTQGEWVEQRITFDVDSLRLMFESLTLTNAKSTRLFKVGDSFARDEFRVCDKFYNELLDTLERNKNLTPDEVKKMTWKIRPDKAFLVGQPQVLDDPNNLSVLSFLPWQPLNVLKTYCRDMIHLPGLRNEPARIYPLIYPGFPTPDDDVLPNPVSLDRRPIRFSGPFQNHLAGILDLWQQEHRKPQQATDKLAQLDDQFHNLGFRGKIGVKRLSNTDAEILVGDCNLADVGLGVSQVLPILVALLMAIPGQIVHIEQPELHLHPGAQARLARILGDAAKRGVLVVVETHSPLILLGIQTLVANSTLTPDMVALNWFSLAPDGSSRVVTRSLDKGGRVPDWPEDFGKVTLAAQKEYLLASLKHGDK
jgi:hypothetical protein